MKRIACCILVLTTFASSSALAQERARLSEDARDGFKSATNAIVALTSDDNLSTGAYKFKNSDSDGPDATIDLYKLVGEFELGNRDGNFTPLLHVSPSVLYYKQQLPENDPPSEIKVDSWSLGAGAGVRMKFFEDTLRVIPRFKIQYAQVDYKFSIAGFDDEVIDAIVPDVNAWIYIPSVEAIFRHKLCDCGDLFSFGSNLSLLYVNASTASDNLDDFTDFSRVWKNRLAYESGVAFPAPVGQLIVRPNVSRIDLVGAARTGLGFNDFYEFGVDVLSREFRQDLFREVGVGLTYIYAKEVQGWRFGFFAEF